jgi:prolyl-tRNA synthetase
MYSKTTEIYVPINGRGIQGATSHCLGQNFSKMFEVQFEDKDGAKQFAWQASWGLSTRSIGAMIMVHSDDQGLVLPPRVAEVQVVVIPVIKTSDDHKSIKDYAEDVYNKLKQAGVRVHLDDRDGYTPGNKYNHWELRGVPIRIEIGAQEVAKKEVRYAKRHDRDPKTSKKNIPLNGMAKALEKILDQIHDEMFQKALQARLGHQKDVYNWKNFMEEIMKRNICMTPWCGEKSCEEAVKDKSKEESENALAEDETETQLTGAAKTLCIPDEQPELKPGTCCFHSGKPAKKWALWGRTF